MLTNEVARIPLLYLQRKTEHVKELAQEIELSLKALQTRATKQQSMLVFRQMMLPGTHFMTCSCASVGEMAPAVSKRLT